MTFGSGSQLSPEAAENGIFYRSLKKPRFIRCRRINLLAFSYLTVGEVFVALMFQQGKAAGEDTSLTNCESCSYNSYFSEFVGDSCNTGYYLDWNWDQGKYIGNSGDLPFGLTKTCGNYNIKCLSCQGGYFINSKDRGQLCNVANGNKGEDNQNSAEGDTGATGYYVNRDGEGDLCNIENGSYGSRHSFSAEGSLGNDGYFLNRYGRGYLGDIENGEKCDWWSYDKKGRDGISGYYSDFNGVGILGDISNGERCLKGAEIQKGSLGEKNFYLDSNNLGLHGSKFSLSNGNDCEYSSSSGPHGTDCEDGYFINNQGFGQKCLFFKNRGCIPGESGFYPRFSFSDENPCEGTGDSGDDGKGNSIQCQNGKQNQDNHQGNSGIKHHTLVDGQGKEIGKSDFFIDSNNEGIKGEDIGKEYDHFDETGVDKDTLTLTIIIIPIVSVVSCGIIFWIICCIVDNVKKTKRNNILWNNTLNLQTNNGRYIPRAGISQSTIFTNQYNQNHQMNINRPENTQNPQRNIIPIDNNQNLQRNIIPIDNNQNPQRNIIPNDNNQNQRPLNNNYLGFIPLRIVNIPSKAKIFSLLIIKSIKELVLKNKKASKENLKEVQMGQMGQNGGSIDPLEEKGIFSERSLGAEMVFIQKKKELLDELQFKISANLKTKETIDFVEGKNTKQVNLKPEKFQVNELLIEE